ncbi:ABC transporter ATP-binding protein [Candidatus Micrarchaeota archaeon]|nr:ABC transporter ATP-binding protein [Candidatus Micrarchaeota archaeon]
MLRLEKVFKIYEMGEEKIFALNSVDFTIKRNDFISILGPSGSGKSTLLSVIGLLDEPTSGAVYFDGVETNSLNEKERAHLRGKKIGFVFQTFNLIPSLTVLENVSIPSLLYGEDEDVTNQRAIVILDDIGMKERIFHYPNQLSGGQRQRAAIARSLINNPEMILADEPTGNLDLKTGQDVLSMFQKLHEEGKTILIITHDQNITKSTEKTIRISDGKIIG